MNKLITVIGSTNSDMVVIAKKFPAPGETVMGNNFKVFQGGKGANQAVAISKLGGLVTFISMLGNDDFGQMALKSFSHHHIQTKFIYVTDEKPTGVAVITLNNDGQNTIVVSPGANECLGVKEIDKSIEAFKEAVILLVQLEIPTHTVSYVIKIAHQMGKKVILNPAPIKNLAIEVFEGLYLITPNETEASELTGIQVDSEASANKAANHLLRKGVKNVIITLGAKGAYFQNELEAFLVPSPIVDTIDTTAAGDIFNGALAVALSEGNNWYDAIAFANKAASIGVGKLGAQASIPDRAQVDDLFKIE